MIYHIFSDESSTTTGKYMVIGGIITPSNKSQDIIDEITSFKNSLGLLHEISWDRISYSNLERYIEFYNLFHLLIKEGKICFKAIIVNKHKYDHKRYNDNNIQENSFYKMYFQLLYHKFCKIWYSRNSDSKFIIFPDEKSSNVSLIKLKSYLNDSIRYNLSSDTVVLEILPQISKNNVFIQMVDLFIGALSYYKNGYYLAENASKSKIMFIDYIQKNLQTENFAANTTKKSQSFEIWNIQFKK